MAVLQPLEEVVNGEIGWLAKAPWKVRLYEAIIGAGVIATIVGLLPTLTDPVTVLVDMLMTETVLEPAFVT